LGDGKMGITDQKIPPGYKKTDIGIIPKIGKGRGWRR